jgi:hypothetical protein
VAAHQDTTLRAACRRSYTIAPATTSAAQRAYRPTEVSSRAGAQAGIAMGMKPLSNSNGRNASAASPRRAALRRLVLEHDVFGLSIEYLEDGQACQHFTPQSDYRLPVLDFSNQEDYFFEGETIEDSKKTNVIKKSLAYICRKNLMKYPIIRNEENVLDLSFESNHISKNQRISLKQRKIEKKILIKLTEF